MVEKPSDNYRDKPRESEVEREARKILDSVGLTWHEIRSRNSIIDWGAGKCNLAKAAYAKGIKWILSIDNTFRGNPAESYIRLLLGTSTKYELEDNSFELIICRQGPLFVQNSEIETIATLEEMNRVLKLKGEIRNYPARLGFIESRLANKNTHFFNAKSKSPVLRTSADLDIISRFRKEASRLSEEYLLNNGFNFSKHKVEGHPEWSEDMSEYWIINKRKNAH